MGGPLSIGPPPKRCRAPHPLPQLKRESGLSFASPSPDFDHVVSKRSRNLFEPVRHAIRHDDHVAFGDLSRISTLNGAAPNLIRSDVLGFHRIPAGHERCLAAAYLNVVLVFVMDLSHARFYAASG